jgi:DNA-binding NarL/FixJ family response regulator
VGAATSTIGPEHATSGRRVAAGAVLVIDDHPVVRHGISEWLARHVPELRVLDSPDGSDDIDLAIDRGAPGLVIVEILRPGGNAVEGLGLVRSIRARFPDLPILVFSRCDERVFAERSLRAGANGFVSKSAPLHVVAQAMRRVIEGQIHLSDTLATQLLHHYVGGNGTGHAGPTALTDRELEVLQLIGRGCSTRGIATTLQVSVKTIEAHRQHIKSKLRLRDGSELLQYAVRWGSDGH